jgi:hypothetical protein
MMTQDEGQPLFLGKDTRLLSNCRMGGMQGRFARLGKEEKSLAATAIRAKVSERPARSRTNITTILSRPLHSFKFLLKAFTLVQGKCIEAYKLSV